MLRLEKVSISAGPIKADFKPTNEERDAAWQVLIDLGTSIATQPFLDKTGHIRDVLSSLHRSFKATQATLRDLRPSTFDGDMHFASVCMALLTKSLGPFLAKWHEPLAAYEANRPKNVSELQHEHAWPERTQFLQQLDDLQATMRAFTTLLSQLAGIRM